MKTTKTNLSHLAELNLAMLFVSTSGALGRYINLPVTLTIASRAVLAFLILWLYSRYRGFSLKIEKKHWLPILLSGVFLGSHWLTYFYSLKLSSVAIGMLSMFTYPIMTSFLEPLLLKTKFQRIHLLLGLLVLTGIYLLAPNLDLGNANTVAVAFGLFSALLYSLRNIILKNRVGEYNGSSLMCLQMAIVAVFLFPFFFTEGVTEIPGQLPWIATLALLTTAIGHTLFLNSFRHFSITTVSILSSVQPMYGIVIGAILLSEIPTLMTVVGGILILGAVVIESIRTHKRD